MTPARDDRKWTLYVCPEHGPQRGNGWLNGPRCTARIGVTAHFECKKPLERVEVVPMSRLQFEQTNASLAGPQVSETTRTLPNGGTNG